MTFFVENIYLSRKMVIKFMQKWKTKQTNKQPKNKQTKKKANKQTNKKQAKINQQKHGMYWKSAKTLIRVI